MENQELINELYERIFSLKDTMYKQEVVIDNVRKKIMVTLPVIVLLLLPVKQVKLSIISIW